MNDRPWENDPVVGDLSESPWEADPVVDEEQQDGGFLDQTWLGRRVKGAGQLATSAYDAAFPERDPRYAETAGFSGEGIRSLDDFSKLQRGKMSAAGFEEPAHRRLVMQTLGDRVQEVKTDDQGNEIVRYVGDDGKEYETYVNQPGLDWQDVDRFISGSVPYLAAAFLTSRIPGLNRSLLTRAPAQGMAAGGVSIGQDIGADQPVDLPKAGITALFGGAGEVAGVGLSKLWRRFTEPTYFDEATGTLTKAGRNEAQRLGLDPDQIQGEVARQLSQLRRAESPHATAAGIESGEFGIPTTKGQRTKIPEQLDTEEQMRRSLFGPGAREVISEFDETQRGAITQATERVRTDLAPQSGANLSEAGQEIGEGLRSARAGSDAQVTQVWKEVEDLYPVLTETATGGKAREAMTQHLRQQFDDLGFFPDEKLTPTAHQMMNELTDYSRNIPTNTPYEILGKTGRAPSLDNMRRRLLARYQGAVDKQDKAAARAIYNGFNDWFDDISTNQSLRTGAGQFTTKDQAAKVAEARQITREQRQLFEPKDKRGKLTPAGRILTELAENADTPERIVQTLFGANITGTPKAGTVAAIKQLKTVFKNDPSKLDQVKGAYFLKMVTGRDGNLLSAGHLNTAMNKAFSNQKSVINQLFTREEQQFIKRFQKAVARTSYKPPNPSGSSYSLEAMRRKKRNSGLQYTLRRLGTRSTFQGKVWQGTMYHWLARTLPNIFGAQDAASRSLARKAIGQTIEFKPDQGRILSAIAASYAASSEDAE
jgi:hypothetical protein